MQTILEVAGLKPIAPYSLAKIVDTSLKTIYLSGQIPINEVNDFIFRKMKLSQKILKFN